MLELRRALRITHPGHAVNGALSGHCTAIMRGCDLAAQIGFTEANKEMRINQFCGVTRNQVQSARYAGIQTMRAQIRETQNG